MKRLAVIVPVMSEGLDLLRDNLILLTNRFKDVGLINYRVIVVVQSKKHLVLDSQPNENVIFVMTDYYSVSNARNIGFQQTTLDDDYILFLDHDAVPGFGFISVLKANMDAGLDIWSGKIDWVGEDNRSNKKSDEWISLRSFWIPYNTFLGCYIIRRELIAKYLISFNTNLGPAEDTYLKTGEDVLFLCELISKNKISKIRFYPHLYVEHPKRGGDNLKNLIYAEGQAAIYKKLIGLNDIMPMIKLSALLYIVLFVTNGFVKVLTFKKNSIRILKSRFKGLISKHDI